MFCFIHCNICFILLHVKPQQINTSHKLAGNLGLDCVVTALFQSLLRKIVSDVEPVGSQVDL